MFNSHTWDAMSRNRQRQACWPEYVQPPSTLAGKLAVQLKPLFGDSCCNYKPSGFPTEAVSVTDFKGQKSGHV